MFPPNGCLKRHPFPPRGPSVWFPRFIGTMGRSDSLPSVSPHFVAFAWRYHPCVLFVPAAGTERRMSRELVSRDPAGQSVEMAGSLRFPSDPHVPTPCSRTPVGPMHARPLRRLGAAPACVNNGGSREEGFEAQSHGIGTHCLRFAVEVTPPHARLVSGCWPSSAGRDSLTRRVAMKGFRVRVSFSFLELS